METLCRSCLPHFLGDVLAHFGEFIEHGLVAQHIDVDVFNGGLGDDEGDDVDRDAAGAEPVGEAGKRFDEQVHALVAELVATGDEEVEGFFKVEVVRGEKVTGDKLVDGFLVMFVEILEFVQGGELLDVQAVGGDDIGAARQEFFRFQAGDIGDGGKDFRGVGGALLNGVAGVNVVMGGGVVGIDPGELGVEVGVVGAEVAAEEGGVGGEDGGDREIEMLDTHAAQAGHPFVELREDGELEVGNLGQFLEEEADEEAEGGDVVDLPIVFGCLNMMVTPEVVFEFTKAVHGGAEFEEDDARPAGDEPVSIGERGMPMLRRRSIAMAIGPVGWVSSSSTSAVAAL